MLFSGVNVPSKAFGEWVEHHYGTESVDAPELNAWIAAGKDIYCEKPIAETLKDALDVARAAKKAGIPVILLDRSVDPSLAKPGVDYVTFIGSDFVEEGRKAAKWLVGRRNAQGGFGSTQDTVVALQASGKGLIMSQLRYADEIQKPEQFFGDVPAAKPPDTSLTNKSGTPLAGARTVLISAKSTNMRNAAASVIKPSRNGLRDSISSRLMPVLPICGYVIVTICPR